MRNGAILSAVFSVRIKAVEALLAAADRRVANAEELRAHATSFDELTPRFGDGKIATAYSAFADLLRTIAMLVEWRAAVLNAVVDANRFLLSARARHRQWLDEFPIADETAGFVRAATPIAALEDIGDVGPLCRAIGTLPLPIAVLAEEWGRRRIRFPDDRSEEKEADEPAVELRVAFVRFNVDSKPANQIEYLTPRELHDLEIEVRVSRWPDQAEGLQLTPMTIEARSTYDLPTFRFSRPTGDPPYVFGDRGRAVLHVPQAIRAQPFEFRYAAEFEPRGTEKPVAVVGHRTLRIESSDRPTTGYDGIDRRIIEIRDSLRQRPLVTLDDVTNAQLLLKTLGNLAGQATQDNLFPEPIDEAEFQRFIRRELRRFPDIGSKLEEHPRAAGGTTDLSFARLRIELKSENNSKLRLADCNRYIGQASSYAAGSDKRIGFLCVLDGSAKTEAPFPPEDGIGVLTTDDDAIAIVTILMQGNLRRPSDLSRGAKRTRSVK